MSQNEAGQASDEESLKNVFDQAMKLFDNVENTNEATNSDPVQITIKSAISKLEKATNLVSLSGMFSSNESLEELPTETLQYLLLPALLGTLTLKLGGRPRKDLINVAEIYFKDFLQRCKDYGVTDVEVTATNEDRQVAPNREHYGEINKIANMVRSREAKIKRYKEMKVMKEKLSTLSTAMNSPTVDDETKRSYFTTLLRIYVNNALDDISSIEQERMYLEMKEPINDNSGPSAEPPGRPRARAPLRTVIITRDAVQKAVFGAGYPSLPAMTVEEFYDQRVRDGIFPAATNIAHTTIQNTETDGDEDEQVQKELAEEADDPSELARKRAMDEHKDDHRRGWGNRHNRS